MNQARKLTFLTALIFIGSCSGETIDNGSDEANKIVVRQMFDAFNRHDWEVMASYFSDPYSNLDPSFGKKFVEKTRTDIVEKYSAFLHWSPDIQDSLVSINSFENTVVVQFASHGTTTTGDKWELPICAILELKNGLITKSATYYDRTVE